MDQAANPTIIRKQQPPTATPANPTTRPTIFQRLNAKEEHAIADCIREYGTLIWKFSAKHTTCLHEAERLSHEIFKDIWTFADANGNNVSSSEALIIENIAARRLIKYKWQAMMRSKPHKI